MDVHIQMARFDPRGRAGVAAADDMLQDASPSHVSIVNSTVANNTSIGFAGGGIAVDSYGTVQLLNATMISHNAAIDSSAGGVLLLRNATLYAQHGVLFINNSVNKGFVGSTIAAFDNSTLHLPARGHTTKCSAGVYLGYTTCQAGEVLQHDMCVCVARSTHIPLQMFLVSHARAMPTAWVPAVLSLYQATGRQHPPLSKCIVALCPPQHATTLALATSAMRGTLGLCVVLANFHSTVCRVLSGVASACSPWCSLGCTCYSALCRWFLLPTPSIPPGRTT